MGIQRDRERERVRNDTIDKILACCRERKRYGVIICLVKPVTRSKNPSQRLLQRTAKEQGPILER